MRDLYKHTEELLPESAKTFIDANIQYTSYDSIMGFRNGITVPFMLSKEDFDTFVRLTDILPKDIDVQDGELVLSEMLANNWGVKEGDILKGQGEFSYIYLPRDMKIKYVLPLNGMQIYGWDSTMSTYGGLILSTTEKHAETLCDDLNALIDTVAEKYPHIAVTTNESMVRSAREQTEILRYFFIIIIVVVAVVFAITLNATFAAMFDKRKYEFSIYKAMGFSKLKILSKVLSEMLVMDGIGLVIGGIACFIVVKVLNEILWSSGISFIHPSILGIVGTLFCNAAIIIPVLIANMKRIKKYDVTVY